MRLRGAVKGVYDAGRAVYVYLRVSVPKDLWPTLEDVLVAGRPVKVEVKEALAVGPLGREAPKNQRAGSYVGAGHRCSGLGSSF